MEKAKVASPGPQAQVSVLGVPGPHAQSFLHAQKEFSSDGSWHLLNRADFPGGELEVPPGDPDRKDVYMFEAKDHWDCQEKCAQKHPGCTGADAAGADAAGADAAGADAGGADASAADASGADASGPGAGDGAGEGPEKHPEKCATPKAWGFTYASGIEGPFLRWQRKHDKGCWCKHGKAGEPFMSTDQLISGELAWTVTIAKYVSH